VIGIAFGAGGGGGHSHTKTVVTVEKTVTVPPGGAGNGKFYVQTAPRPTGCLEICKHESGTGLENQVFTFSVAGHDYTVPVGGQAVVAVYCGANSNCTGSVTTLAATEVDVFVYYGFNDLNLLGGAITISGSSRATTSW